jgi:hypothetical protein
MSFLNYQTMSMSYNDKNIIHKIIKFLKFYKNKNIYIFLN